MKNLNIFKISILAAIGLFSCSLLQSWGIEPILASALVGGFGSLLTISIKTLNETFEQVLYCASFAAIGIESILPNMWWTLLVILNIAFFFVLLKSSFSGYGGKLGTIAFIANFILWGLNLCL